MRLRVAEAPGGAIHPNMKQLRGSQGLGEGPGLRDTELLAGVMSSRTNGTVVRAARMRNAINGTKLAP